MPKRIHVAVVGAGAFGGWTALYLLRNGARVTLIDAWGPGNSRSSSGGETRVIRGTYGPHQPYTAMVARALKLWRENERKWKCQLVHRIGVLWMAADDDDSWENGSIDELKKARIPYERLSSRELKQRWPQINFEGVEWGVFEPKSGYVKARISCQRALEGLVAEGGEYRQVAVSSDGLESEPCKGLSLSDKTQLKADRYVFACGPWMAEIFPHAIGDKIRSTKQEVFFFGPPAGDPRFDDHHLPVWADHRGRFMYGIPGNQARGFKIADDTRGPDFDPTAGERIISDERLSLAREYMAFRFPGMKNAPLVEARVCQYEQTSDSHLIIDRHPVAENAWLVGGGSGHGFKHGPALGEMVAKLVLEDRQPESRWRLDRFKT
jgi:glycine/D-amino acid oxidase-like deaminating enzyme